MYNVSVRVGACPIQYPGSVWTHPDLAPQLPNVAHPLPSPSPLLRLLPCCALLIHSNFSPGYRPFGLISHDSVRLRMYINHPTPRPLPFLRFELVEYFATVASHPPLLLLLSLTLLSLQSRPLLPLRVSLLFLETPLASPQHVHCKQVFATLGKMMSNSSGD